MDKPIIEVKGLGKRYDIAHMRGGYVSLRDVIAAVAKRPFSYLKHKTKQVVGLEKREAFWALKGVDFTVNKGEVIGIIGRNGAGKSTLLKVLSQITPPTEGEVILRGRVGSLLEVGTGFHPELTGRENIFLNGAILGMKRAEIAAKFDEIVAFAGVEKFLDTPVKHYSSGMYVRLAFSVAAHMEPDILIIDEVLAVGDAEFQKKCLGKMDDITRTDGRTILFVSHNLASIQSLCSQTILLESGHVKKIGPTEEVIGFYQNHLKGAQSSDLKRETRRRGTGAIKLTGFRIEGTPTNMANTVISGEKMSFILSYECKDPQKISLADVGLSINKNGSTIATIYSSYTKDQIPGLASTGEFLFTVDKFPLAEGTYTIGTRVLADGVEADWPKGDIGQIEVSNPIAFKDKGFRTSPDSSVLMQGSWSHKKV